MTLAWPEGEKLRITQQVSGNNLSLKIKQSGDWFELDGKLQVDENLVLTLRQLLDLSQTAKGRFVQMADGQFLTLTRQFQKKLDTLRAYAETSGKNGLKVGALAGMVLEDFIDEAGDLASRQALESASHQAEKRPQQPARRSRQLASRIA